MLPGNGSGKDRIMEGKVVIFSAPSGAGKSTIVNHLLGVFPELEFSVSATCRAPRGTEVHGKEYYFLSYDEFVRRAGAGEFVEWEEVYPGCRYGTLKSEVQRIWEKGNVIIFDIDVKGGVNLKKRFGDRALALFVMPPSVEELERRLIARGTDSPETIRKRVDKAQEELEYAPRFDRVIVNDDLEKAKREAETLIRDFLK